MKKLIDIEKLKLILPHGSGINGSWYIERKEDYVYCANSFHCMNDNGFYDGWADFTLKIPIDYPTDFKLIFNGQDSQYMNRKYSLREYLEDLFAHNLYEDFHKVLLYE